MEVMTWPEAFVLVVFLVLATYVLDMLMNRS